MAVTDINFSEGEGQDFIVEVTAGSLNPAVDFIVETSSDRYPVIEIEAPSGGGDIFIINE